MGQRLNIEIVQNEISLANAYYHWSAYTLSSLQLAQTIIDSVEKIQEENDTLYAIRLLETTGALLTEEEITAYETRFGNESFRPALNRNDGLIAFTKEGMEETRKWEEHRMVINLDEEVIYFDVICTYDKEEYLESYEETEDDYKKMPLAAINFTYIPFHELKEVTELIRTFIKQEQYNLRTDSDEVISFIA